MDMEQLIKTVDWLDDERRRDKTEISRLEERIKALEGNLQPLSPQIKDLKSEIDRMTALMARMDSFDERLLQQRIETKQYFEELERQSKQREDEAEKVHRVELRALETAINEVRKGLEPIPEIRRVLQSRAEEQSRLQRLIDETRARIEEVRRSEEEYTRTYRLLDDGRRQDAKRLTDLQGEVAALRKRSDEQRGKVELNSTGIKRTETRLNELAVVETERREAQEAFLETQAMLQMERERQWKEWQARFETIENQTADIETNLQKLDTTHRDVRRALQSLEELNLKVDRRINEITEIQRLAEERFRQEWVTFKADDQKRWTNYTLTLEEQRSEVARQHERLVDRTTNLEDRIQEVQDLIVQINEQTEKRLQSLLSVVHDWVAAYERALGRAR